MADIDDIRELRAKIDKIESRLAANSIEKAKSDLAENVAARQKLLNLPESTKAKTIAEEIRRLSASENIVIEWNAYELPGGGEVQHHCCCC